MASALTRPLAVSLGDPAGIGPEVVAKCWDGHRSSGLPAFVAVGDPQSIANVWDGPIELIDDVADADAAFDVGLPILQVLAAAPSQPGRPNGAGAHCSLDSLELAVGLARSGMVDAVVTGPVSKQQLYAIGFSHPGQTEFVAERCGIDGSNVAMMLAGPTLRVVPVTTHVSLAQAVTMLTPELIDCARPSDAARAAAQFRDRRTSAGGGRDQPPCRRRRRAWPRGNRHHRAGRSTCFARKAGTSAAPCPPTACSIPRRVRRYDAALCMYHDQALIPLKALHFDEGVNMTLGLPIVRTSPDHGTAFDIAGQDRADPRAMMAAIRLAATCAAQRRRVRLP